MGAIGASRLPMGETRAERRRAPQERELAELPKQTKFTCANPLCDRAVRKWNKFSVCHVHIDIIQTIQWLLQSGVLKVHNPDTAKEMGLWTP